MIKHLWISAVCFLASPLLAMTINHVEIEFPPSNYEWKLLADEKAIADMFEFPLSDSDADAEKSFQVFTHREGDALEVLAVTVFTDADLPNEEIPTAKGAQHELDEELNCFFPNHRLTVNALSEDGHTVAWEWNDGSQDLMHGFTRLVTANNGEMTRKAIISYSTTAVKSEYNQFVWHGVLNQAHFAD